MEIQKAMLLSFHPNPFVLLPILSTVRLSQSPAFHEVMKQEKSFLVIFPIYIKFKGSTMIFTICYVGYVDSKQISAVSSA